MKGLSIEEKAKRYDEAIERAKEIDNEQRAQPFNVMKRVFPELSELKDEMIRKKIIDLIKEVAEDDSYHVYRFDEMIAWLEKREIKEHDVCDTCDEKASCVNPCPTKLIEGQKPTDKVEPKFKVGDVIRLKGSKAEYMITIVTDTTYYTNGWSCSIERCEEDYELVEQKPIDKVEPKFKVGDKIKLAKEPKYPAREIIAIQNDAYYFDKAVHLPFSRQDEWELVEQNPAWSEEDELMLKYTIEHFEREKRNSIEGGARKNSMQEFIDWLKSLKDRVQPQPRKEWSEEDENHVKSILSTIECCKAQFPNAQAVVEAYNADIEWLKSLRPQSQWKPSDMELEVLRLTAEKDGTCLMGLYEQLKKLREK